MTERERFEQFTSEILRKDGCSERRISRLLRKDEYGEYEIHDITRDYVYWQAVIKSAIPDGYILVPEQPTPNMLKAGASAARLHGTHLGCDCEFTNPDDVWEAMLGAVSQSQLSL